MVYPIQVKSVLSTSRQVLSAPPGLPRAPYDGIPLCAHRGKVESAASFTVAVAGFSKIGFNETPDSDVTTFELCAQPVSIK